MQRLVSSSQRLFVGTLAETAERICERIRTASTHGADPHRGYNLTVLRSFGSLPTWSRFGIGSVRVGSFGSSYGGPGSFVHGLHTRAPRTRAAYRAHERARTPSCPVHRLTGIV